jgi:transcriptional regulator with XRE-family HTH domain
VSDPATSKKNPLGPTGERVIANVKLLRQAKGMTYKQLSERLEILGRPIPVLGLSRLERGERRVDVDDLVAIALALEVTPNRLMMPDIDLRSAAIDHALTSSIAGKPQDLWIWAQGEQPLGTPLEPLKVEEHPGDRQYWFINDNKPYLLDVAVTRGGGLPGRDSDKSPEVEQMLGRVLGAAQDALARGLGPTEIRCAAELAIVSGLTPSDGIDEEAAETQ